MTAEGVRCLGIQESMAAEGCGGWEGPVEVDPTDSLQVCVSEQLRRSPDVPAQFCLLF